MKNAFVRMTCHYTKHMKARQDLLPEITLHTTDGTPVFEILTGIVAGIDEVKIRNCKILINSSASLPGNSEIEVVIDLSLTIGPEMMITFVVGQAPINADGSQGFAGPELVERVAQYHRDGIGEFEKRW